MDPSKALNINQINLVLEYFPRAFNSSKGQFILNSMVTLSIGRLHTAPHVIYKVTATDLRVLDKTGPVMKKVRSPDPSGVRRTVGV